MLTFTNFEIIAFTRRVANHHIIQLFSVNGIKEMCAEYNTAFVVMIHVFGFHRFRMDSNGSNRAAE